MINKTRFRLKKNGEPYSIRSPRIGHPVSDETRKKTEKVK